MANNKGWKKSTVSVVDADYDYDDADEFASNFASKDIDVRHGHTMYDLFNATDKNVGLTERFTGVLNDILFLMSFSSPTMSNFFDEVTECLIKRNVRQFMKLLTACWCAILIKSMRDSQESMTQFKFSSAIFLTIIVIYLATFSHLSRREYKLISLGLMIGSLTYTIYETGIKESTVDGAFGYPFSLIILMIIFLPLTTRVVTSSIVLFCFIFVIISSRKMAYSQSKRNIYANTLRPMKSQIETYNYTIISGGISGWADFTVSYQIKQSLCWLAVVGIGLHLRFWNKLRQRSAFFIIGKSVIARKNSKRALQDQSDWISAIMPIQVRDEYMTMYNAHLNSNTIWAYSVAFDEVSILFSDIVGFTKMSSTKTATKMVMLLNDLYNRFDELSVVVNCEKIGTLGDCYYAVAGCPIESTDHAASCVEFGLGMCRIIKVFNKDNSESVNMRVGVHTGRVNAAIIGNNRFRYDVYSTDVIIANMMESSGLPGRVHISRPTYKLVKDLYRFAEGEPQTIIREEQLGIAGTVKKEVQLKTYFVDPLSSKLRSRNENYGRSGMRARVLTVSAGDKLDDESDFSFTESPNDDQMMLNESRFMPYHKNKWRRETTILYVGNIPILKEEAHQQRMVNMQDIHLIQDFHEDPKQQLQLFRSLPLKLITMQFTDKAVEAGFIKYMEGHVPYVTIDSPKMSPCFDTLGIFAATLLLVITGFIDMTGISTSDAILKIYCSIVLVVFSLTITIIFVLCSSLHSSNDTNKYKIKLYVIFSNTFVKEIILAVISLAPALCLFTVSMLQSQDQKAPHEASEGSIKFAFGILCILIHAMASSSCTLARGICILINGVLLSIQEGVWLTKVDHSYCESYLWYQDANIYNRGAEERLAIICTLMAVTFFISIENERSLRLWYYVNSEAETSEVTAREQNRAAQQMLDNVIPRYVFILLAKAGHKNLKAGTFVYANSMPRVAVTFACLTNFFSGFYREDYKGGESALKLLNTIICSFDEVMALPEFFMVEKIKTINDCYMIAAGLNKLQRDLDPTDRIHIIQLMEYNFALYRALADVNDKYIIGTDKFLMKIGYYIGDVTAGIIGSKKPIYDIWGNTVNVASRMYSTGTKGQIQVPEEVKDELSDIYDFEYRGSVFVKGKGDMQTYFCHQKGKVDNSESIENMW